jgi:uncharacterized protein (DUF427 family)
MLSMDMLRAESVWDYPRPPRVELSNRRVRVIVDGVTIIDTTDAVRVLETSHPPGWYVPIAAFTEATLERTNRHTVCEFKGRADYFDIVTPNRRLADVAWGYPQPAAGFEALRGRVALYPGRVDACMVDDEVVVPQEGGFYGGWITADVRGPFKGGAGTLGW